MAGLSLYDTPIAGAVGPGVKVSPFDVKPVFGVSPEQVNQPIAGVKPPTIAPVAPISKGQLSASIQSILDARADQTSKPTVRVNEKTKELFVNGLRFHVDDADNALKSREYLSKPSATAPTGDGWRKFSQQEYEHYLDAIENPTPGEIFGKNFRMGLSNYAETTGALQQFQAPYTDNFFGTEQQGAAKVAAAQEQLRMRSPYNRKFADIGKSPAPVDAAVDWFAATAGQLGPGFIESVGTALVGAAAGGGAGSAGGPGGTAIGTAAGALGGLFLKKEAKAALFAALKKRGQGIALDAAEQKLVRTAAAVAGAAVATGAVNYGNMTGQIYNEVRQGGAGADNMQARETAALYAIPASALENLTEFAFGMRVFGGPGVFGQAAEKAIGGSVAKRFVVGVGVGGVGEGLTEVGQEALQIAASDKVNNKKTLMTDAGMARMIESFAAGFVFGAPLGGIANLAGKDPVDLANNPEAPPKNKLLQITDARRAANDPTLPSPPEQLQIGASTDLVPNNIYDGEFDQNLAAQTSRDVIPTYDEYSLADNPDQLANRDVVPYGAGQPDQLPQIGQAPAPLQLDYTGPAPTQYPEDGLPFGDNYNPPTSDVGPNRYSFTTQDGREVVQAEPFILPEEDPALAAEAPFQSDNQPDLLAEYEQLTTAREQVVQDAIQAQQQQDEQAFNTAQDQLDAIDSRLAEPDMQQAAQTMAAPVVPPGKAKLQKKAAAPKATVLKKGKANVVQEPSPAAVAEGKQAGSLPAAPAGKPGKRAPARARAAVDAQAKPIKSAPGPTVPTETPVQATVEEAAKSSGKSIEPQTAPLGSPKSAGPVAAPTAVSEPKSVLRNTMANAKAAVKDGIEGGLKTSDAITAFQQAVRDLFTTMLNFDDGTFFGNTEKDMLAAAKDAFTTLMGVLKGKNIPPHVQEHAKQQVLFAQQEFVETNNGLPEPDPRVGTAKLLDVVYGMESPRMRRRLEDGSELDADAIRFGRDEVTSAVDEAMAGWANKPKVTVYLDTGELRTLNRKLYDKIKRANPMFDTAGAVEQGVYVRSEGIILFSSAFTTKKEIAFVLAHEALGHYGLRAVLSDAELRSQLKYVYDNSPNIRAKADALAELYGNDPIQNTEEVLADMAGEVQPNIISRLWRALKAALGLADIGDVWARYMISRARKYIINGDFRVVSPMRLQAGMFQFQAEVAMSKRTLAGTPGSILWDLNRSADNSRDYTNDVQGLRDRLKNTSARGAAGATVRWIGRALEAIQTLDNMSARNEGLSVINDAFRNVAQRATTLKTKWRNMTGYTRATGGKYVYTDKVTGKRVKVDGPQAEDLKQADEMLAASALHLSKQADETSANQYGDLFKMMPNGDIVENKAAIAKAKRVGIMTPEQFSEGFDVFIGEGGDKRNVKIDVTAQSPAYMVYKEQREAINDAAVERLRAAISNQGQVRAASYKKIGKIFKQMIPGMDTASREFIERIEERYSDMYYKNSKVTEGVVITDSNATKEADEWLKEVLRALHNLDKRNDWFSPVKAPGHPNYEVADRYKNADNQFIINGLKMFGNKSMPRWSQYQISNIVRQQVLNTPVLRNANLQAIKTITSSYVPFYREGKYQLRIQAVDRDGNIVRLDPKFTSSLIFKQDDDQDFLMGFGREINDEFRGVFIQAPREILDPDAAPEMLEVELRAVVESSAGSPPLGDSVNLNEVVRALNIADVNLKPSEREKLILTLTRVGERVRKASLRRVGLTGWNQNVIQGVETHLDTEAHIAAKDYYRYMIDDTMADRSMWNGDRKKLDALQAAIEKAPNSDARDIAQREYDKYAIMYVNSAPRVPGKPEMVKIGNKMVETKGRGNEYMEKAKRLQQWFDNAGDLAISQNDFLSNNEFGSKAKALTVASQLGGVVASAAVNIVSIYTHAIPYLAGYNSSTGRGGGFGTAKTTIEINRALNELKHPQFAEAEFLDAMVASGTWEKYGLTKDEALFLRAQTEEGILQAAQANALIGSARGGFDRTAGRAFEAWMGMFTYVEQLNRRTTALAAYRMYRDRALAAGGSKADLNNDQSKLFKDLHDAGRDSVNFSQGDYSMYNRPEMFRDNWMQYVFMYKMFVINTIQLLRNMPPKHRMATLGLLFLMSGLKGLPFADDIMDLIDTLARMFGIKVPSIEKAVAEFANEIIPGSAPILMRGFLDSVTGATFSTRFGMGDLIPLTGSMKPGADFQREFENFAGPVYGALMGYTRSGLELAHGMPLTTVLRDSPMAAIRAAADSLIFAADGKVTNAKGQVVNPDVGPGVIVWRALGFFPAESTITNDTIRLGKAVDNYAKSIKATYVQKYILAKNSGDSGRVAGILRDVERWNRDAKGTGLEMKDFRKNAEKSYKEASRPAGERYLRTTGKGVRSEVEQLQEMYGLTD